MLHFLPFAHTLGRIEQFISFDANLLSAYAESMDAVGDNMAEVKPHIMVSVPRLSSMISERSSRTSVCALMFTATLIS